MFRPGLAFLLILLAAPAGADIYKWSDAQGNIHYGDQPPSGSNFKPFHPQTPGDAAEHAEEARRQAADQAAKQRLEEEQRREAESGKQAAGAEEARRKAENCQRARSNLELLQRMNMRLTTVDSQGNTRVLDAAGRQAEIDTATQAIADNCAN